MKYKVVGIAVAVICILLTGCNNDAICGEVQEKEFLPAYSTTILQPYVLSTGKSVVIVNIPMVYSYPDRWKLTVKNESDGKLKTVDVTQECFDSVEIGDYFIYNVEYCSYEEPVTRKEKE